MDKMNQNNFPKVWYSSEEKIMSTSKLVVFDDRGSLDISGAIINYNGKKNNFNIKKSDVKNISMKKHKINWKTYLIVNAVMIFYFISAEKNIIYSIILLGILNVFGLLIGISTKWVLIEYTDKNKVLKKVYFANGSMLGWSGLFGGTRKIYNSISNF